MIGDVHVSEGKEFEVIWAGGEGLIQPRDTRVTGIWSAPKRLYTKKSDYWNEQGGLREKRTRKKLDNSDGIVNSDTKVVEDDV